VSQRRTRWPRAAWPHPSEALAPPRAVTALWEASISERLVRQQPLVELDPFIARMRRASFIKHLGRASGWPCEGRVKN
jgi:hypothetical protein